MNDRDESDESAGRRDRASSSSLIASLRSAIVRADGDALVMHVGEPPYVVALSGIVELSDEPVTLQSMTRLLDSLLPADDRAALESRGAIQHELVVPDADGERFRLVAAWGGDDIWTEIRRYRRDLAEELDGLGLDAGDAAGSAWEPLLAGDAGGEAASADLEASAPRPGPPDTASTTEARGAAPPGNVVPLQRTPADGAEEPAGGVDLDDLIRRAWERRASTLYLVTQSRPMLRLDGEIEHLESGRLLEAFEVEALVQALSADGVSSPVSGRNGGSEWIREVADVGRVRCVSFRDQHGPGLICRITPERSISAAELGLSREIQNLVTWLDGLVVVTGQRLSGKSTLMSALVDLINTTRSVHVISLERQIEFPHEHRRSFVSQREVRGSGAEMAAAVRTALREDPDVLAIGDMRSGDVIVAALEAAEAGRLVIGAIPASGTAAAIGRMLDHVPADRRGEYRRVLAGTLRGAIAQVLLRKTGGGRLAARELLLGTRRVTELIAEGKIAELPRALDSGRQAGMVPMNDALAAFVQSGAADAREAYRCATDRDGLIRALQRAGIDTSFTERRA